MTDPLEPEVLLANSGYVEARDWLLRAPQGKIRSIGELHNAKESLTLIEQLYRAGAICVYVVDIDVYMQGENTGKLVVELPANDVARSSVFAWERAYVEKAGFTGEPDVGQKYLLIFLD